jgi:hypothetical protein
MNTQTKQWVASLLLAGAAATVAAADSTGTPQPTFTPIRHAKASNATKPKAAEPLPAQSEFVTREYVGADGKRFVQCETHTAPEYDDLRARRGAEQQQ